MAEKPTSSVINTENSRPIRNRLALGLTVFAVCALANIVKQFYVKKRHLSVS